MAKKRSKKAKAARAPKGGSIIASGRRRGAGQINEETGKLVRNKGNTAAFGM